MDQPQKARITRRRSTNWLGNLLLIAIAVLAIAVRFQIRSILDPIRRFNRRYYNRIILGFAGERGTSYAVIRHVGRRSGQKYQTPVFVRPIPNGYLLALYYGTGVDWLRNLQAAGGGKIFYGGGEHEVGAPEIVDQAEAASLLSEQWRLIFQILGVKQYLRLTDRSVLARSDDDNHREESSASTLRRMERSLLSG